MSELIRYDAACRALADARSVDEARGILDTSAAMRAYAKQAKNKQLEADAAEIRFRAERRVGELMAAQKATVGLNNGLAGSVVTGTAQDPVRDTRPTLAEAGIDKHLADRARKMAAVPQQEFEDTIAEWRGRIEQENERVTVNLLESGDKHVRGTLGTGENEWYTPVEYIDAARAVEVDAKQLRRLLYDGEHMRPRRDRIDSAYLSRVARFLRPIQGELDLLHYDILARAGRIDE